MSNQIITMLVIFIIFVFFELYTKSKMRKMQEEERVKEEARIKNPQLTSSDLEKDFEIVDSIMNHGFKLGEVVTLIKLGNEDTKSRNGGSLNHRLKNGRGNAFFCNERDIKKV
jgi:hypothetical protein